MPTTSNFGWTTPADTDLVKDGALAIRTLGNGIDTSFLDLKGGTTDQVLAKNSNTDLDFKWVAQDDSNAIQNAIVDAKGDLISATAADTPARLAVGANGTVLTADSTEALGLKWAAPAGGGKVLQVVSATLTGFASTTSASLVDTGLTVSITPSLATSKVLVLLGAQGVAKDQANGSADFQLLRDSTVIQKFGDNMAYNNTTNSNILASLSTAYLDSPATTSSTTYKLQFAGVSSARAGINQYANNNTTMSVITVLEIGA